MRVLGVDPGSVVTGFGVVERDRSALECVAAGAIRTRSLGRGPESLTRIHQRLLEVIDRYQPTEMSLERNFVALNVQSAFRIGEARAIAMLAAGERGLKLFEYPPNQVKLTVVGFGHANKSQVKSMVRRTLALRADDDLSDDAADALALALCHLSHRSVARMSETMSRRKSTRAGADRGRS